MSPPVTAAGSMFRVEAVKPPTLTCAPAPKMMPF